MTQPTVNPYKPSSQIALEWQGSEPLRFSGVIERADYQQMLPRQHQEVWLCAVLAVLLGISILVFGPLSILLALSNGQWGISLALILFWSLMLAAMWFLKTRFSSKDRTTRNLKKYPDVLGLASGEISDLGLTLNDGVHTCWFGPEITKQAAVRQNGIRIPVDGSMYRYLALTARLFENYRSDVACRLKRHWVESTPFPASDDAPNIREFWERICEPPTDAVPFGGVVTIENPIRTVAVRNRYISELLVYLASLALVIYFRAYLEPWTLWVGVLMVGYGLMTNIVFWWPYSPQTVQQSWYQFGWITDNAFAMCSNSAGVRMPLTDIVRTNADDEAITLMLHSGAAYFIPRHLVANEDLWDRLRTIAIKKHPR